MTLFSPFIIIITIVLSLFFLYIYRDNNFLFQLKENIRKRRLAKRNSSFTEHEKIKFINRFQKRLFIYGKMAHSHRRVKFWRYYSHKK